MRHLKARMIQSGHLNIEEPWDEMILRQRLAERFQNVKFEQAKNDVLAFIKNPDVLSLWSTDFFQSITKDLLKIETTTN